MFLLLALDLGLREQFLRAVSEGGFCRLHLCFFDFTWLQDDISDLSNVDTDEAVIDFDISLGNNLGRLTSINQVYIEEGVPVQVLAQIMAPVRSIRKLEIAYQDIPGRHDVHQLISLNQEFEEIILEAVPNVVFRRACKKLLALPSLKTCHVPSHGLDWTRATKEIISLITNLLPKPSLVSLSLVDLRLETASVMATRSFCDGLASTRVQRLSLDGCAFPASEYRLLAGVLTRSAIIELECPTLDGTFLDSL